MNTADELREWLRNLKEKQRGLDESSESFKSIQKVIDAINKLLTKSDRELEHMSITNRLFKMDLEDIRDCYESINEQSAENVSLSERQVRNLNDINRSYSSISNSQEKINDTLKDNVTEQFTWNTALNLALDALEASYNTWKDIDDKASKTGRSIGLGREEIKGFRQEMISSYKDLTVLYGVTNDELYAVQESIIKNTGRAITLTKSQLEGQIATSKLVGQENADAITAAMDKLGGSVDSASAAAAISYARAKNRGLDAKKSAEGMAEALKMSQKYTFKEGVDGMSKMVAKAQELKLSLSTTEKMMDNFSTIEGAIQSSAKLQVLGGEIGQAFSNPIEMMGLAMTDAEGFQEKMTSAFKNLAFFDESKGRMDMSMVNKMKLKAVAESQGISYDEAWNMATQQGLRDRIDQDINASPMASQLSKENKEWLRNKAQYNTETGKFEAHYYDENGDEQTVALDQLNDNVVNAIKHRSTPEEEMRDDVSKIRDMIENSEFFAKDTKSLAETLKGAKESAKDVGASAIDPAMGSAKWWGIWLSKLGWPGALAITGLAAGGGLAWKGVRGWSRNKFKKPSSGRGGSSSGGGGGGAPSRGISSRNATSSGFRENYQAGRKLGMSHEEALNAASEDYRNGGGSKMGARYNKAKMRMNRGARRAKVGGRKLLKTLGKHKKTAAIAGAAVLIGYAYNKFSGNDEDEESRNNAYNTSNEQNENQAESSNIESDGTVLGELQKQTAILESISKGQNADVLNNEAYNQSNMTDAAMTAMDVGYYGSLAKQGYGAYKAVKGASSLSEAKTAMQATKTAGKFAKGLGAVGTVIAVGSDIYGAATANKDYEEKKAQIDSIEGQTDYEKLQRTKKARDERNKEMGGDIGGVAGAAIGGVLASLVGNPMLGAQIGEILGSVVGTGIGAAVQPVKDFFVKDEEEAEIERDQRVANLDEHYFERKKMGPTSITDPQLMQKAAVATIQIQGLLASHFNKEDGYGEEGEDINSVDEKYEEANEVERGVFQQIGDFFGFSKGGEVPESKHPLPNAKNGDNVLAALAPGEVVLNKEQQAKLIDALKAIGLVNESEEVSSWGGVDEKENGGFKETSLLSSVKDIFSSIGSIFFPKSNNASNGKEVEYSNPIEMMALANVKDGETAEGKKVNPYAAFDSMGITPEMPMIDKTRTLSDLMGIDVSPSWDKVFQGVSQKVNPLYDITAALNSSPYGNMGGGMPNNGVKDINLNINGTIKLTGGNSSTNIDVKSLMNDPTFQHEIFNFISSKLDSSNHLGVAKDLNSPMAFRRASNSMQKN